jgi:hypothetical protein
LSKQKPANLVTTWLRVLANRRWKRDLHARSSRTQVGAHSHATFHLPVCSEVVESDYHHGSSSIADLDSL